jgi:hypothetical protein
MQRLHVQRLVEVDQTRVNGALYEIQAFGAVKMAVWDVDGSWWKLK